MGCFDFDCNWVIWVILILCILSILSECCDCGGRESRNSCGC